MTRLSRPPLALLAVLLVALLLAGTAGALGPTGAQAATDDPAPQPKVVSVANTTNHLSPPEGATGPGGYARADLDVAGAVATSVERLDGRHDQLTVSERLYGAEQAEVAPLATRQLDAMAERLAALRLERDRLLGEYGDGAVSRATFTRRFGHIQAATAQEAKLLTRFSRDLNAVDPATGREVETRLATLRGEIATLRSPVGERMAAAMNDSRETFGYYVAAGPDAHVLAMAADETFFREAADGTSRNPGGTNQFAQAGAPTLAAFNRAAEMYTWTFANAIRQSAKDFGTTQIYQIDVEHDQGLLQLFLDGATREVFREVQTKDLGTVPTTRTAEASSGGLALALNTTVASGPMRVELTSTGIDAPVDGTVRIDGEVVGRTGSDGVLWTVQPTAGTAVNATAGGDSVVARP